MSHQFLRRITVFLIALIALMSLLPGVSAQITNIVELVGAIESMSSNTITVNSQTVDISAAEINTALEVGAIVKVEGALQGGVIVARQVNAVADGLQPGEAELVGVVESMSGSTLVVNGQTIDISAAEVQAGVVVGETVKVHGIASGANIWQARQVELFQAVDDSSQQPVAGEFEVTGTLDSIGSGVIVVAGQTISIGSAEINDPLVLGTLVKIHVSVVNGQLTAREVENAVTGADDNSNANDNAADNSNTNENSNDNAAENGNDNAADNSNDNADDNGNDNTSAGTAISAQQAIDIVLGVYPTTTIRSIELTTKFGGTLVWEVKIGNRIELNIDAQSGVILTIDRPGDDNNQNGNANSNGNDNRDDNGNGNDNRDDNGNGNDNNDDNGGNNNDNSGGDNSGGMGGDDSGGMGG